MAALTMPMGSMPEVIVKTPVFNREDRLDHDGRDHCQSGTSRRFWRASATSAVIRGVSSVTLSSVRFVPTSSSRSIDDGLDRLRALCREDKANHLTPVVAAARDHDHRVASDGEFSWLFRLRAIRIPEVVQTIDDLRGRQRLAATEFVRPGKDAGVRPLRLAREPRIDHLREADVEVGGDDGEEDERRAAANERVEFPATPLRAAARRHTRFRRHGGPRVHWHVYRVWGSVINSTNCPWSRLVCCSVS